MRIVLAGGSGFLGASLAATLARHGHQVTVLTRRPDQTPAWGFRADPGRIVVAGWAADGALGPWAAAVDGAGAVVNLAGASIGDRRWSAARRRVLRDSRLLATRSLVAAIGAAAAPPATFVSASAVGYYGSRGDEPLTETSGPGDGFLASLCVDWEEEAQRAAPVTRVARLRTGLVLAADGGSLERMMRPFRWFVGGPIATGRQWMSWIHRDDWIGLVEWAIHHDAGGPLNATAAAPVTNRDFARALGRALGRPSVLPVPAFALRLVFGQMADELLTCSQRVLPARALELGFHFRYGTLDAALRAIVKRR